jgi:hypothetical protein
MMRVKIQKLTSIFSPKTDTKIYKPKQIISNLETEQEFLTGNIRIYLWQVLRKT